MCIRSSAALIFAGGILGTSAWAAVPTAAPPSGPNAKAGGTTVRFDGSTGEVLDVSPHVNAQTDVIVEIQNPGEAHTRYRVEAKTEDEPDPQRLEVATLGGSPPGSGPPAIRGIESIRDDQLHCDE